MSLTRVYCGVSLDGFIAGPDDQLHWLEGPEEPQDPEVVDFVNFMAQIGALLMGRRTFEIVQELSSSWPYGDTPVFVATSSPPSKAPEGVHFCSGDMQHLCERAKEAAGARDVYIDGGNLVTQAMEAGCVDEMILTVKPVFLGRGIPLYGGRGIQRFQSAYLGRMGDATQLRLTPLRGAEEPQVNDGQPGDR